MSSIDWLSPLSAIYGGATSVRNLMFDLQILPQQKLPVPIVSIGNITAGGTGKTPMVIHLAKYLANKGCRVGIVSRGYGRKQKGVAEVVEPRGGDFGDEPSLMKQALPDVPVFVGESRVEACRALLDENQVSLLLADDAFQHRYLKRSMDIVLIDATQPIEQYKPLPSGRAREGLRGLSRATHLIFTKVNAPGAAKVSQLKDFLKPYVHKNILETSTVAEYKIQQPRPLIENSQVSVKLNEPVVLVSAIGRPEAFESQCMEMFGITVKEHKIFRDHHTYSKEDVLGLGSQTVFTTEKDRVKLLELDIDFSNWFFVPLEVELKQGSERFYEELVGLSS